MATPKPYQEPIEQSSDESNATSFKPVLPDSQATQSRETDTQRVANHSSENDTPDHDSPHVAPQITRTLIAKSHQPSPLTVGAGVRFISRSFSYRDDLFGRLQPYSLTLAPAIVADVEWFPAAHFTSNFLSNIGIAGQADYVVSVQSSRAGTVSYPTVAYSYSAGLKLRYRWRWLQVASQVGYAAQNFSIRKPEPTAAEPEVPDVSYQGLAFSLGSQIALPRNFFIQAEGGYLAAFSLGEIGTTYFPRATAGGLTVSGYVGYNMLSWLQVRMGANLRRYFYNLNPEPGDRYVAGGAVDQYVGFDLSLGVNL